MLIKVDSHKIFDLNILNFLITQPEANTSTLIMIIIFTILLIIRIHICTIVFQFCKDQIIFVNLLFVLLIHHRLPARFVAIEDIRLETAHLQEFGLISRNESH